MASTTAQISPDLARHLCNALDGRWHMVKGRSREQLSGEVFRPHYTPNTVIARTKVLEQLKIIVAAGSAEDGFRKEHGGTGDVGAAVTTIEMLAMSDLSLMVKAGVQWGLFGGAIENLGTERHHEAYVRKIIDLELLGCFAMTETGHGSDVQSLETTATYDRETDEFVINSPTKTSRKDYIGGAAETATMAAVFAQLITAGPHEEPTNHGVHCFVVPIRDEEGNDLPGVTTSDCDYKGGLPGVDNGRIVFDNVRVPRDNLLNKYGDVADDDTYSSPIDNPNRRFFTMLGTLVRGRVTVGGSARGCAGRAGHCHSICVAAQAVQGSRRRLRGAADGLPRPPASGAAADREVLRAAVRAERVSGQARRGPVHRDPRPRGTT